MKINNLKELRKKCKKLIFKLESTNKLSSQPKRQLATTIGVNYSSLVMSLSGYRSGAGSMVVLKKLHDHLKSL